MTHLLGQLHRWRFTERLIRLAWGASRWLAVLGAVLAVACCTDWLADRYLGSETWRKFLKATWVLAPGPAPTAEERWFSDHMRLEHGFRPPPAAVLDDTPMWLRTLMTGGQALLAVGLAYFLLVRPWRRTPPIDDLASEAERAIPKFGHRLVTAVQLNRPGARTAGMSQALISEVTREAGEMAAEHNLLRLVDYRRLLFGALVLGPVALAWLGYALWKPDLTGVLLKRQLLLSAEIPRGTRVQSVQGYYIDQTGLAQGDVATGARPSPVNLEVRPTGAEVVLRFRVDGQYDTGAVGRVRIEPDGQPEEFYDLAFERKDDGDPAVAYFVTKLPASSLDFSFTARLDNGRTRESGRVRFEGPPQLAGDVGPDGKRREPLTAEQILPAFLGLAPDGQPYVRRNEGWTRGELIDALPLSGAIVRARFNKPVSRAKLVPIERDGVRERDLPALPPDDLEDGRTAATWQFPTTARLIAYRLELTDDRGFTNSLPIRRNVRMLDDRPPVVTFMPESTRHPDPEDFEGKPEAKAAAEWGDKLPLAEGGRVMVIHHARSEQGISRANIAYRIIPKGVAPDAYPKELQEIQHPRQDPEGKLFTRLTLKPVTADLKAVGAYVPDLGLFEQSWHKLNKQDRYRVNVEFYTFPSPDPKGEPPGLEAGGRYMFEIDGLTKKVPTDDGKFTTAKLEVGDTVELFVEVFDKNPTPGRAPGYTKEARRKIVVTGEEAYSAIKMRDEQNKRLQDKVRDLAADQANVFRQTGVPKDEPKK